jgi:hypothetical protein
VHAGIDFAAATGTPSWRREGAAWSLPRTGSTGKDRILEHFRGLPIYMLLDTLAVAVWGVVERGDRIGTAGATVGHRPHLHWD